MDIEQIPGPLPSLDEEGDFASLKRRLNQAALDGAHEDPAEGYHWRDTHCFCGIHIPDLKTQPHLAPDRPIGPFPDGEVESASPFLIDLVGVEVEIIDVCIGVEVGVGSAE